MVYTTGTIQELVTKTNNNLLCETWAFILLIDESLGQWLHITGALLMCAHDVKHMLEAGDSIKINAL